MDGDSCIFSLIYPIILKRHTWCSRKQWSALVSIVQSNLFRKNLDSETSIFYPHFTTIGNQTVYAEPARWCNFLDARKCKIGLKQASWQFFWKFMQVKDELIYFFFGCCPRGCQSYGWMGLALLFPDKETILLLKVINK